MPSERQEKVSSLIGEVAARTIHSIADPSSLITVTNVSISPDLKNCTIYISVLPDSREEQALAFCNRHAHDVKDELKKSRLRSLPYITFKLDQGEKHRQRIDELSRET